MNALFSFLEKLSLSMLEKFEIQFFSSAANLEKSLVASLFSIPFSWHSAYQNSSDPHLCFNKESQKKTKKLVFSCGLWVK